MKTSRIKVWMLEQSVLAVLVALAMRAQILGFLAGGKLTARDGVLVLLAAVATMIAQKTRSMADRQKEDDAAAGIVGAKLDCHRAQARWGLLQQVVALAFSTVFAATGWHLLIALYVGLYSEGWRRFYRARIRAGR